MGQERIDELESELTEDPLNKEVLSELIDEELAKVE